MRLARAIDACDAAHLRLPPCTVRWFASAGQAPSKGRPVPPGWPRAGRPTGSRCTSIQSRAASSGPATATANGANSLVGIIDVPERPLQRSVLLLPDAAQYRVGSHCQFTLLSRMLAARGIPVMRFDLRVMGESEGDPRAPATGPRADRRGPRFEATATTSTSPTPCSAPRPSLAPASTAL